MGFTDFVKGAVEAAHGKHGFIDTAADIITEPGERMGQGLHAIGTGINAASDRLGEGGDWVQRQIEDKTFLPDQVGSAANFFSGGGAQWVGRSFGDLGQGVGTIMQHEDDALKGVHHAAQFTAEHPNEAKLAVGAAGTWALNHKQDIGEFAGKAVLDSATDPASLALMAATGGGSSLLGLAEGAGTAAATAGAEAAVEGGTLAATRAATAAAARQIATNVGERTATGLANAGVDTAEATVGQQAKAFAKQTLTHQYTGTNTPSTAAERAAQKLSRNPTGRLAQARRGWAEGLANWGGEGSLPRQIAAERVANIVEPGTTMPSWGGRAAADEWLLQKGVKNANRVKGATNAVEEGAKIATDPTGYAMNKLAGSMDTATTGSVTSSTQASSAISGDLMEPGSTVVSGNQFAPKGPGRSFTGMKAPTDTTTGDSVSYEVRDPYAEGSAYGQVETGHTVKDPYKQLALTQPKEKPNGVLKPDKKAGVYA